MKAKVLMLGRVIRRYPASTGAVVTLVHFYTIPPLNEFETAMFEDVDTEETEQQLIVKHFPAALLAFNRAINPVKEDG